MKPWLISIYDKVKKLFIDTNILLDVFLERDPFCLPAQILWSQVERKEIRAAVSAVSVNNIFFIIRRLSSKERAYAAVETLTKIFKILDTTSSIILKALRARLPDFEDAIQYYSALQFGAEAIISRDPSGFEEGKIAVMDAAQFLAFREE